MIIRPAIKEDLEKIREIYAPYYPKQEDLDHFVGRVNEALGGTEEAVRRDMHYLVAEQDGSVVAVLGFRTPHSKLFPFTKTERPVELYSLFSRAKGGGAGKALVKKMFQIVREKNYSEVVVYSNKLFQESWGFYDALDFERVGDLDMGRVWRKPIL